MSLRQKPLTRRKSPAAQGYDRRWQKARRAFLSTHPLCMACKALGRPTEATEVDHIKPHKGDTRLFWDTSNWQPLCANCHAQKTAREDGGFGNARASAKTNRLKKYGKFGNIWLGDQEGGRSKSLEALVCRTGAQPPTSTRELRGGGQFEI